MTLTDARNALNREAHNVFSSRAYKNSQDVRVWLVDAYYPDDVERIATFLRGLGLTVDVITAQPIGGARRRRCVVTGFSE